MKNNFTYSISGITLTEKFEGVKLTAYQDQGGVWTIGYGHTLNVSQGDSCTQEQAQSWLESDIQNAANAVNILTTYPLTQNQFDALVDFTFNLGSSNLETSTLLKLINQGELQLASEEFDKWDHIHSQTIKGLFLRRQAETNLFES